MMSLKRRPSSLVLGLSIFLSATLPLLFSACGDGVKDLLGDIITATPTPGGVVAPSPLDLGHRDDGSNPGFVEGLDAAYAQEILVLTNQARQANGLSPLSPDANLEVAAASYAQLLAVNDWFDHVGPDGSTVQGRAEAAAYQNWLFLAENLAKGTGIATAPEVVDAWMASPGHRENILNSDLEEIGVACYFLPGLPPRFWCVQEFGTQREPTPTPEPTAPPATATPAPSPTPTPTPQATAIASPTPTLVP